MPTSTSTIYDRVTNRIVDALKRGTIPWVRPWRSGIPFNAVSRREYSGINVLTTFLHQVEHNLTSNAFLTYNQALQLGGHVRKGARGCPIVYYARVKRAEVSTDQGEEDTEVYFLARLYTVFGIEQCVGLEAVMDKLANLAPAASGPIEECERLIAATGATIHQRGVMAFYNRRTDEITVPPRELFRTAEGYFGTIFHELCHWTAAPHRLNRELGRRFGDHQYSAEELIAEITAAYLAARVGIDHVSQAASYIASWLAVLQSDNRAIFRAARLATDAANFLYPQLTMEPSKEDEPSTSLPPSPKVPREHHAGGVMGGMVRAPILS